MGKKKDLECSDSETKLTLLRVARTPVDVEAVAREDRHCRVRRRTERLEPVGGTTEELSVAVTVSDVTVALALPPCVLRADRPRVAGRR